MTAATITQTGEGPAPGRSADDDRAEVERILGAVARAALEVLAGCRPVTQLRPLIAPPLVQRLHQHRGSIREADLPRLDDVGPIEAEWPTPDACEATVLCRLAERTAAMALRMERRDGAWRVVEAATPDMPRPAGPPDDRGPAASCEA